MYSLALVLLLVHAPLVHAHMADPDIEVTLAFPSHGSIPQGAQRVVFLTLSFGTSCRADQELLSLRLVHRGRGEFSDIARVYGVDSMGMRITGASSPGAGGDVQLSFRAFELRACSRVTMHVMADISRSADMHGEHGFAVSSAADIHTRNAIVSLEPARQDRPSLSSIVPYTFPTVSVRMLATPLRISHGGNRTLARMNIHVADGDDQEVHSVTLTNAGSARDGDIERLVLGTRRGDIQSQEAVALIDRKVQFFFLPPLLMHKNRDRILLLRGDVRTSRRRSISFFIDEPSDVYAVRAMRQRE